MPAVYVKRTNARKDVADKAIAERTPIRGIFVPCCAYTIRGQVAAAPARRIVSSRRRTTAPLRLESITYHKPNKTALCIAAD